MADGRQGRAGRRVPWPVAGASQSGEGEWPAAVRGPVGAASLVADLRDWSGD